jgi:drug/metabolite transporter (DMT)-like permease
MTPARVVLLTAAALTGFVGNSLLTRGALGAGLLDAGTFTLVRLATGAITLWLLSRLRRRDVVDRGSWRSAGALAGYAIAFTLAYRRIDAGVGALVLFGAVQATMIGSGLMRGERPRRSDWIGVAIAIAGLVVFTLPGAAAPDAHGTALMVAAGICWGIYSLAGRHGGDPLGATAGNFARATLAGMVMAATMWPAAHVTTRGLLLAATSGALASGVAYTIWYAVLPSLTSWRAAILQLTVPVLTAASATVLLGERITVRLVVAGLLVASGVGVTLRR